MNEVHRPDFVDSGSVLPVVPQLGFHPPLRQVRAAFELSVRAVDFPYGRDFLYFKTMCDCTVRPHSALDGLTPASVLLRGSAHGALNQAKQVNYQPAALPKK